MGWVAGRTDQVGGTWCHHHRQTSDLDKPAAVRVSVSSPETQHRGDMTMLGGSVEGEGTRARAFRSVCMYCASLPRFAGCFFYCLDQLWLLVLKIEIAKAKSGRNVEQAHQTGMLIPSQATGMPTERGRALLFSKSFHVASSVILPFAQANLVSYTDTHSCKHCSSLDEGA